MAGLRPGQWQIGESDQGWTLSVRPEISWRVFVPRTPRQWVGFGTLALLWVWFLTDAIPDRDSLVLLRQPLGALMFAVSLAAGIAWSWWLMPPPILGEKQRATAPIRVEFRESSFETSDGTFKSSTLASLRLSEVESLPGRYRLAFTGSAVSDANLIGWPGLSRAMAEEVMAAVMERAGLIAADEVLSSGSNPNSATEGACDRA